MTIAELMGRPYLGAPLAIWMLGGGIALYVFMHRATYGSFLPSPTPGGIESTVPSGPALPRPEIYMPEIPMPVVQRSQYTGVHY